MTGTPHPLPNLSLPEPAVSPRDGRKLACWAALLVLAGLLAYSNSFSGPFIYDDKPSIPDNPTLHHLWPPWAALSTPPGGVTVDGRPVLNLSLAINYALGGLNVKGYHAANLLIHLLAGLVLLGIVRRTLLQSGLRRRFGAASLSLAASVAILWTLHPLQTESVTYLVQRAESLMGLFYLLTLYAFIRASTSPRPVTWLALSVLSCLLGVGTKEVTATAPMMVLLYDRTFFSGNFRAAWRNHRRFYLALACTWIPLGFLVAGSGGNRGGSMGFGIEVSWWDHALTQFEAIARYLCLSLWPQPLVFNYGSFSEMHETGIISYVLLVTVLVVGVIVALRHRPAIGFLGAWFLIILAPTSLLPQAAQIVVEHRMYLPLAAVIALIVPGLHLLAGPRSLSLFLAMAMAWGLLTFQRNRDYRSEIAIWQDTATKRPNNAGARCSLGAALADAGRMNEAIIEDEAALRLRPNYIMARNNLGVALTAVGRPTEAIRHLETSLHLEPNNAQTQVNLGVALDTLKRTPEALPHYEAALRLNPYFAQAHNNLGDALSRLGRSADGIAHLQIALSLKPDYLDAHYNLAAALARAGRLTEAQAEFAAGLRLKPGDGEAHANWASVLLATGHPAEAIPHFAEALRLHPESATDHYNYASALARAGQLDTAVQQFESALRLQPDYADAHNNLGNTLTLLRREADALPHYEAALRLKPANPTAHNNLGLALARLGRLPEAAAQFAEAVRLAPDFQEARENLSRAQEQLGAAAP